jgi:hypothetical protein
VTSPWPKPDYAAQVVMCCLCFEVKSFSEMSVNTEKELTDVCQDCRLLEIQLILKSEHMIEAIINEGEK